MLTFYALRFSDRLDVQEPVAIDLQSLVGEHDRRGRWLLDHQWAAQLGTWRQPVPLVNRAFVIAKLVEVNHPPPLERGVKTARHFCDRSHLRFRHLADRRQMEI